MAELKFEPRSSDGRPDLDAAWFEALRQKYLRSNNNEHLRSFVDQEVDALRDYYISGADAESSADEITRPISTSSIPALGSPSDESAAIITLWYILTETLQQCPASQVAKILSLLSAIGQLPQTVLIHRGEATDAETGTRPLTWDSFPYFSLPWSEFMREPGEIVRDERLREPASDLEPLRREYIRQKDIEAQLISRRVLHLNELNVNYVAKTFERVPDTGVPSNEGEAFEQNRLEFQIPAVAALVKWCGAGLFRWVVHKNGDRQRWIKWEDRAKEIADGEFDSITRNAAEELYGRMKALRAQA